MVIYDAQKCLIFNKKHISANQLPWFGSYLVWYCLLLWLCLLIFQACGTTLYDVSTSAFIFTQYTNFLAKSLIFSMSISLLQLLHYLSLQYKGYKYSFAFHGNAIDHSYVMPNWPIMFHALFCFIILWGQGCIMYDFSLWMSTSCRVFTYTSSTDVHTGIITDVLMPCTFILCQWFPSACFLYSCSGITSSLCTSLDHVCI